MDTVPSHYNNGPDKAERRPVTIGFEVLPKHSPAMLMRIREHNEPIWARLRKIPYHTNEAERRSLKEGLIPYPMFQDEQYGYVVMPPGLVPKQGKDFGILSDVLHKVCANWKSVDDDKPAAGKIIAYFSYR